MEKKFYKVYNSIGYSKLYFDIKTKIGGNDVTVVLSRTEKS